MILNVLIYLRHFISLLKKRITSIKRPGAHFNSELIVSLYISRSQISNFQTTNTSQSQTSNPIKISGFLMFLGDMEWEHYLKMD